MEKKKSNNSKNVISFKPVQKSDILTEQEINSLFLGFVSLIKRNVILEKEKQYKTKINAYHKQIQNYVEELRKKNAEITILRQQLESQNAVKN